MLEIRDIQLVKAVLKNEAYERTETLSPPK
jgi:hypothetical protein